MIIDIHLCSSTNKIKRYKNQLTTFNLIFKINYDNLNICIISSFHLSTSGTITENILGKNICGFLFEIIYFDAQQKGNVI